MVKQGIRYKVITQKMCNNWSISITSLIGCVARHMACPCAGAPRNVHSLKSLNQNTCNTEIAAISQTEIIDLMLRLDLL